MKLIIEQQINDKKIRVYDFDAEIPYKPGEFNKKYKTSLIDKVQVLPKMSLKKEIVESFLDCEYTTVKTIKDFYLYRIYGEYVCKNGEIKGAKKCGAFATTEFAESTIEVKERLALDPLWLSTKMYEVKIHIPIGVILNIGKVAPIKTRGGTTFAGGADQVLLPLNWSEEWIVGYRRVTLSQLHRKPEYSSHDPTQQTDKSMLYPHTCPICDSTNVQTLKDDEQIQYIGSKGRRYKARFKCLDCLLHW